MATKLLAQREILSGHFSSITSQAGPYCGQPSPGQNVGSLRPVAKYDVADLTYSKQTTSAGNVGGTTLIDSDLAIFGDDYWIGASVTIGSETRDVSDFSQATGTITVSVAFSSQVQASTDYTLTLLYSSRDWRMQLIAGGDPGSATFKWSHDGGVTYLGRNNPYQATWQGEYVVETESSSGRSYIVIRDDGLPMLVYYDSVAQEIKRRVAQDIWGLVWGSAETVVATTYGLGCLVKLRYGTTPGRILFGDDSSAPQSLSYASDDDLATVGSGPMGRTYTCLLELFNGTIIGFRALSGNITCCISNDGGNTVSDDITVAALTNTQAQPHAIQLKSGRILCAFSSDEAVVGEYGINGAYSSDYGLTWAVVSEGGIIDYTDTDFLYPFLIEDLNGDIYCIAEKSGDSIVCSKSTASSAGYIWSYSSPITVTTTNGQAPSAFMIGGSTIATIFTDSSLDISIIRRGMWEAYSANACQVAPMTMEQQFGNCSIVWYGGAGIAGDTWSWSVAYQFSLVNLLQDSPSACWRSAGDNVSCSITLDMGTTGSLLADGIAVFGTNIRSFTLRLDSEPTPEVWAIEETVSFDVATGTVDTVVGNAVQDTSLLAAYKDHALKGKYFRATSGTDSDLTWLIADNVGSYIMLDISAATNLAASDTFAIFASSGAHFFSNAVAYRYCEINIPAQQTAEDYYQIGTILLGKTIDLTRAWDVGYHKSSQYGIDYLGQEFGVLDDIKRHGRKRRFELHWSAADDPREEIEAILDYIEGRSVALIPDSTAPLDAYLCKRVGDLNETHWFLDYFHIDITFEEIL